MYVAGMLKGDKVEIGSFTTFRTRAHTHTHTPKLSRRQASVLTSIVTVLVKTDEHTVNLQLFFRKFQQKSKTKETEQTGVLARRGRLWSQRFGPAC